MRGRIATAPDGTRWRVRRRWLDRPLPRPWRRWRRHDADDGKAVGHWSMEALAGGADSLAGLALGAVVVAALALFAFVLLPLLGIAIELALVVAVVTSGVFGRVVLRRPWIVEAAALDGPARRSAFAVTGWRRSRRALAALAGAIEATGPPSALPEAEPLAVERPLQQA